jgi:hypothetical protein
MKSMRLNIRALAFDGKTPLSSNERITYNSKMASHCVVGSGALRKFGVLRMSDLVKHEVIGPADHVYAAWVGHSGEAGVTSFVVSSQNVAKGQRVSTSSTQESDPSAGTGPVGPFALRPADELVLTSNGGGEQLVALEIFAGTAVEVEGLLNRGHRRL